MESVEKQSGRITLPEKSNDLPDHWILRLFGNRRPLAFEAGDANLYRYAGNKPTNATDPSGFQPLDGGETALEREMRRFYEKPSGTVNATYSHNGNTYRFRVTYTYFSNAERDLLIARLGRLRAALAEIMAVLPAPVYRRRGRGAIGPDTGLTDWARVNPAMQARLRRWFGNGQPLNNNDYGVVWRVFNNVLNAFNNRNLGFKNDFEANGTELAWAVPATWYDIHLRPAFYDARPRQQIGTLFHELTHYYGWTDDHGYVDNESLTRIPVPVGRGAFIPIRRPGLPTYEDGRTLTVRQLVDNADTYEGFLEDFFLEDVPV